MTDCKLTYTCTCLHYTYIICKAHIFYSHNAQYAHKKINKILKLKYPKEQVYNENMYIAFSTISLELFWSIAN